ncbi:site-specific integrase [Micromonospora sp. NBC_01405]|uniref:hypothetical protein n=1 Tax=Micromonospora sp. NBC_01405 TaxID=2903589 RepID=UPI003246A1C9
MWAGRYLDAAVRGLRSAEVADEVALHLARFRNHFHERLSAIVQREVVAWRTHLTANRGAGGLDLAPATVNTHLASLSGFTTWVCAHDPVALPLPGRRTRRPDPARHISPLRPRDLRHSFAFALAEATGSDAYELEHRLGHQSQRYTNPPEDIPAGYMEHL